MRKPAGWGSVIDVQLDGEGLLASERSLMGWIRLPAASLCRCWEESGWVASRLGPAVTQLREYQRAMRRSMSSGSMGMSAMRSTTPLSVMRTSFSRRTAMFSAGM